MSRLVQWDPFRLRLNADAVAAAVGSRAVVTFNDGFLDIASGPLRARATLQVTPPHDVRLTLAVNDAPPGLVIEVALNHLLPPFADVRIAGAEITKDGIFISLGEGGADPP